jgi:accessory colonization factor AcfC
MGVRHRTGTAGPTGKWLEQAKCDVDVVFSGSESMMSDLVTAFWMGSEVDEFREHTMHVEAGV